MQLLTIGYEDASVPAFIGTLQAARVTLLLDVREFPSSRRPGFSKTPLSKALAAAGIGYRHERALGAPPALRRQLRASGDRARFLTDYGRHLARQSALLDELAATLTGRVALMCLERDPKMCHRSIVAEALRERAAVKVKDLFVPDAP